MEVRVRKLLIANRGEIAIRIARAAEELGIATVAVCSQDDASSLHTRKADECHTLLGDGARAYLDAAQLVELAKHLGCDALHPGYGFLSESAELATLCEVENVIFVGPTPAQLALFGDKVQARALAERMAVPLPRGSGLLATAKEAQAFFTTLGQGSIAAAAVIKAAAGGGGRGMRVVRSPDDVAEAFARCQSEARAAFGNDSLYMEELIVRARHIEVQVIGDGRGQVVDLGERECSLQRRHQKLVEIAPSPSLSPDLRGHIVAAALHLARETGYQGLGTFEFLVARDSGRFVFIEANPRLQVEHTVTEEVCGVDLVKTQLRIAGGATLAELGLQDASAFKPRGHAIQLRVNLERIDAQGAVTPSSGTITAYEVPTGRGVRVDACGFVGYTPSASFDSLVAKVIVHAESADYAEAVAKAKRALSELRIDGIASNVEFLQALVSDEAFAVNDVHTTFIEENAARLATFRATRRASYDALSATQITPVNTIAPLVTTPDGVHAVNAPLRGRVVSFDVAVGDVVRAGQQLAVVEAMKMESAVTATTSGTVRELRAHVGQSVAEGQALLWITTSLVADEDAEEDVQVHGRELRADLLEVNARHERLLDAARPKAVEKRRKTKQRTARENIAGLCDAESFVEYGGLAIAAQRRTRSVEELIEVSPADGLVGGVGTVNGAQFGTERTSTMIVAYDYTVFAGTQGMINHKKQDRLFALARDRRLPLVLFAEGGGGRPGDTDFQLRPMLDLHTFRTFAELSGLVPLVGVVSGRCFAGNAVLLGCCDVIIATEDSNIGLAGPVMIEGAGLGTFSPEAIGPIEVQSKNGVVDVRVKDEVAAVATAKKYLAYFQGTTSEWTAPDVERLRRAIPENRMRTYDMRTLIADLADTGSVLELRREFGVGMITALVRIEGRPCGVFANEPSHLAGAIDADAADKAARFMRLCNAFGLPLISLCDTPGFMVGPEAEKTALARHTTRMLVAAASLEVPMCCVVVRKGYGLGAMAMAGGSLHAPFMTLAWPTGELGAMGLEGAVLLGIKKQLAAIEDPAERKKTVTSVVALLREQGKAVNVATHIEIDDVIDPADTRRILTSALRASGNRERDSTRRTFIDTW